jgi:hypothetical protein
VGRPEWRPGRGITDIAVEAQAEAMISQPQRVSCREGSTLRDAAGCRPASSGHSQSHLPSPAAASSTASSRLLPQPSAAAIPSGLVTGR